MAARRMSAEAEALLELLALLEQGHRIDQSKASGLYRFRHNRTVIVGYSAKGLLDAIRDFLVLGLI